MLVCFTACRDVEVASNATYEEMKGEASPYAIPIETAGCNPYEDVKDMIAHHPIKETTYSNVS